MKAERRQRRQIDATGKRLEVWRRDHGGPGRAIPEELWREVVEVARVAGVDVTARAFRLDRGRLASRVSENAGSAKEVVSSGFVEVDTGKIGLFSRTVVRFEGMDGERMQVELSGGTAVDVVELAKAFWRRSR